MESAIQLFQRKFRRAKPSPKAESPVTTRSREQSRDCAAVVISKPAVNTRLLFFKECHMTKEQKVIYDSNQRQSVARNNENQHHQHVASDWSRLSEIVFGSIGISRSSSSVLKIHQLSDSTQLMISHVFSTSMNTDTGTQSLDRGMERMNGAGKMTQKNTTNRRKARTMPAPLTSAAVAAANLSFDQTVSQSMVRSESILSLTTFLSRSFQGSMKSAGKLSPSCPCDSASNSDESSKKMGFGKVKNFRLAFGLIFEPEPSDASCFNQFFFQHFPLFEHHLRQLKKSIENAVTFHHRAKPNFNANDINEALDRFTMCLNNVYATPRLPEMVWAKLTWSPLPPDEVTVVKNCFIGDLSRLVLNFENNTVNKQRFSFTCSLITAVLTHHLGWVSSLITSPQASCLNDNEVERNDDGQVEMYNTLWAQLRDLYGAVDYPTKMCKTVVTGSNHEIVSTVLAVLSYFIRSARVDDTIRIPEIITPESFERSSLPSYTDAIDDVINQALVHSEIEPHSDYVLISINKQTPTTRKLLKGGGHRPRSQAFITDSSPRNCEPLSFGVFSQLRRSRRKAFYHRNDHHGNNNNPHLSISPNTSTFDSVSTASSSSCGEKDEAAPSSGEGNFCDFDDEPPSFMSLHHRRHKESPSSVDTDEYLTFPTTRGQPPVSNLAPEIKISSSCDNHSPPSYEAACCNNDDDVIDGRKSSAMLDDDVIDIEPRDNCSLKDGGESVSVAHLMTSSSDFMSSYEEIPLDDVMSFESELEVTKDSEVATGFASLMADYNPCYLNDFVLQGVAKSPDQIKDDVVSDLKRTTEMSGSILDDDVDESCCVVADSDSWSVKIFSSKRADTDRPSLPSISSKLVHNLLLQTANMYQMKIEPTFCLQHLENCLRVVAMKSQTLARHVKGNGKRITTSQLSTALSIDKLDIPLLMAVSSTCYSPMTKNDWL